MAAFSQEVGREAHRSAPVPDVVGRVGPEDCDDGVVLGWTAGPAPRCRGAGPGRGARPADAARPCDDASGGQALARGGGEDVLLTGADADVDRLARLRRGARGNPDDDLAGVLARAELGLRALGADQLAVDVGVGAELLDEGQAHGDGQLVGGRDHVEGLGAEADDDAVVVLGLEGVEGRAGELDLGGAEGGDVALDLEAPQVHGRGADEAGDELVGGLVVHLAGGAHLLEDAVLEHRDAVAHGQRLGLVVRDVHRGNAQRALERGDLGAGLDAELGVQVGQRLVHEEDLGLAHDGTAHGDALALAAGESLRLAVEVLGQAEDLGRLPDPLVDLVFRGARNLEGEAHVVVHAHMRVQGVVLEDHGDVAVLGLDIGDVLVPDENAPGVDVLQTGEHAQRSGLAASGGADQDEELAVGDREVQRVHARAVIARVDAGGVIESHRCHEWYPFTGRYVPDDPL